MEIEQGLCLSRFFVNACAFLLNRGFGFGGSDFAAFLVSSLAHLQNGTLDP